MFAGAVRIACSREIRPAYIVHIVHPQHIAHLRAEERRVLVDSRHIIVDKADINSAKTVDFCR